MLVTRATGNDVGGVSTATSRTETAAMLHVVRRSVLVVAFLCPLTVEAVALAGPPSGAASTAEPIQPAAERSVSGTAQNARRSAGAHASDEGAGAPAIRGPKIPEELRAQIQ